MQVPRIVRQLMHRRIVMVSAVVLLVIAVLALGAPWFASADPNDTAVLDRLKHDAALRDDVAAQQLIRDGLAGLRTLDAGYTLRILARLRQVQQGQR